MARHGYYDEQYGFVPYDDCPQDNLYSESEAKHTFSPSEPKTNADRIRSMTDEELAWFIYTKTGCDHKCMHWNSESCSDPDSAKVCGEVWLEWLKQEIKTN